MNICSPFKHGQEGKMGKGIQVRRMGGINPYIVSVLLLLAGLLPGCGPKHEEIMAMEQERLQREARESQEAEAIRQAEQAKQERIRATVAACSDSAAQGELDIALLRCQEALKNIERYSDQDRQVRETIIKVVRAMPAPPPIPEETLRSMARGEAKVKMGGAGSYEGAAKEMEQAVLIAPWLADAYFNLGIVQEKGEIFGSAIQNFQLFLLAAPQSPNAKAVQTKIYALEVLQEDQVKMQSMAGSWRSSGGNIYQVVIEGKKIKIRGESSNKLTNGGTQKVWRVFDFEKKGDSLEGSVTITPDSSKGCNFPNETVPATGVIGRDGRHTKCNWKETRYQWTWQGSVCTGVSSLGKDENYLELVERVTPGYSEVKEPIITKAKKKK